MKNQFIMLVGLPGVGKSSISKSILKQPNIIALSSDSIRKELFGREEEQKDPKRVFALMHERTLNALSEGKSVIYDATNITRRDRLSILSKIPASVEKVCIIVWAKFESCLTRNASRTRHVPEEAILKLMKRFEVPYWDEGWDKIDIKLNDDNYKLSDFNLNIEHDNHHHVGTIQHHIDSVIEAAKASKSKYRDLLVTMAKYHDVGKAYTKAFKDAHDHPTVEAHYYNHSNVSGYLTLGTGDLKLAWLVYLHMEPHFVGNGYCSDYYKNVISDEDRKILIAFNECDKAGA